VRGCCRGRRSRYEGRAEADSRLGRTARSRRRFRAGAAAVRCRWAEIGVRLRGRGGAGRGRPPGSRRDDHGGAVSSRTDARCGLRTAHGAEADEGRGRPYGRRGGDGARGAAQAGRRGTEIEGRRRGARMARHGNGRPGSRAQDELYRGLSRETNANCTEQSVPIGHRGPFCLYGGAVAPARLGSGGCPCATRPRHRRPHRPRQEVARAAPLTASTRTGSERTEARISIEHKATRPRPADAAALSVSGVRRKPRELVRTMIAGASRDRPLMLSIDESKACPGQTDARDTWRSWPARHRERVVVAVTKEGRG